MKMKRVPDLARHWSDGRKLVKAKKSRRAEDSHTTPAQRKRKAEKLVGVLGKEGDLSPEHQRQFDALLNAVLGVPKKK
jgi:hypothetical protein